MSAIYAPTRPSAELRVVHVHRTAVAAVAAALLALAGAAGFAAASLLPYAHPVQRTTFVTP